MDTAQRVQPGLFGDDVEQQRMRRAIARRILNFGPVTHQYKLKIRTRLTPRVIEFKPRLKGEPQTNDFYWTVDGIVRLHLELLRDWEERFADSSPTEQVSFWLWMLGDPNEDFSFRTCLSLAGFNADEVIGSIEEKRPDWYRHIETMTDEAQILATLRHHIEHSAAA